MDNYEIPIRLSFKDKLTVPIIMEDERCNFRRLTRNYDILSLLSFDNKLTEFDAKTRVSRLGILLQFCPYVLQVKTNFYQLFFLETFIIPTLR